MGGGLRSGLIQVTDRQGEVLEVGWLGAAEAVHRQLRPQIPDDYVTTMRGIFAQGGRMVLASHDELVVGVAVFRIFENTFAGRHLYVDDLVTDERHRSEGVGARLLTWLEGRAREEGCSELSLDSGVQRPRTHRFYFRHGMHVASFRFRKLT